MLEYRKITWEIRDKNGQLISFEVQRPNSYVQHLINILYASMSGSNLATQTDTTGGTATISATANPLIKIAAANLDGTYGLVVGTDNNTAVAIGQTQLVAKLDQGTGADKISHGAVTVSAPSSPGTTRSFTAQRTFTNNHTAPITIKEIGIYALNNTSKFMIERALSTKTINNGTSGTLTYTIGTTV